MKNSSYILLVLFAITASSVPAWAGGAILSWNPNPERDLAGYRVYYGESSSPHAKVVDVGLTSTPDSPVYTVNDLVEGKTYFFAVTAYDSAGNESGLSNEVSKLVGPIPSREGSRCEWWRRLWRWMLMIKDVSCG